MEIGMCFGRHMDVQNMIYECDDAVAEACYWGGRS